MAIELTQEILDEVCRQKSHSWRRYGATLAMHPPAYPEQCKICGKRRTAHEHDEPYWYTYFDQQPVAAHRIGLTIRDLRLSVRARKILLFLGCQDIESLLSKTSDDILEVKQCGKYTVREIQEALEMHGLSLKKC